ncbi:UNVERIFIED_CONTAM: hypothetical protein Slati_0900700 [Sesamum latifolium]|uniref:Uncharacterized protein n=1 Tax=Sesamum latifolium TaxID=2727402 RepID=A0AAW2XPU6_9LAMI
MDALHQLKARWEAKIGPLQGTLPQPRTSLVDANPLVRSFRMARRTLAPLMPKESTGEAPLLMIEAAEKGAAHSSLAPPNPNPREEVAPPRVTHDAPAPMAGSSPVHRDRAPHMESSAAAPNIFIGKVPLRTYPMLPQPENQICGGIYQFN